MAHGALVAGLREKLPASNAAAESAEVPEPDREQAAAACQKLEGLLANDDGEATDFAEQARNVLRGYLGSGPFDELKKAIDQYDFERARQLLRGQVRARESGR
jgi:hypothetical protein